MNQTPFGQARSLRDAPPSCGNCKGFSTPLALFCATPLGRGTLAGTLRDGSALVSGGVHQGLDGRPPSRPKEGASECAASDRASEIGASRPGLGSQLGFAESSREPTEAESVQIRPGGGPLQGPRGDRSPAAAHLATLKRVLKPEKESLLPRQIHTWPWIWLILRIPAGSSHSCHNALAQST